MRPGISIIIPCYNSSSSLVPLLGELESVLTRHFDAYEIIAINDYSSDDTWQTLKHYQSNHPRIKLIDLAKNFGQHNATICGVREAKYEISVTLDDDGQNPPAEIPLLVDKLLAGYDIVYGIPQKSEHDLFKVLTSKLFRTAISFVQVPQAEKIGSFRAFRTSLRDGFAETTGRSFCLDFLLFWSTQKITCVNVSHNARQEGCSNYDLTKLLRIAEMLIMSHPESFARILMLISAAFAAISVLIFVSGVLDAQNITTHLTVAALFFLAGTQTAITAFVLRYLIAQHYQLAKRPLYIIREKIESDSQTSDILNCTPNIQSGEPITIKPVATPTLKI